jgi:hypothetical protein
MRLLTLTMEEINNIVEELDGESKALKKELFKMAWFMRGSLSIDEAFMLDYQDRTIIGDVIKDNLETTKESKMPFF